MTAPAAVSWAARFRLLHLENTRLAFLGFAGTPYILSVAAIGELVVDKLPKTPSRKAPVSFVTRLVSGALCGAAIGASNGASITDLPAGVAGAIAGTVAGSEFRARLVKAFGGKDLPIAVLEDAIAIGGSFLIVSFANRLSAAKTRS